MLHDNELERIRSALSFLDYNDEDAWVKAAMCLKSEMGDEGFDTWDAWGSQYARYKASSSRSRWKSIKATGGVTIGSLFYDAKAAGWKDDKKYPKPSREVIEQRKADAALRQAQADEEEAVARAAAADHARYMWDNAKPVEGDAHPYLQRKGVVSHGLRVGAWEIIDHESGDIRTISEQALLVPIRDTKKLIHSLQAIFPGKVMGDRDKDFVKDGAKSGLFYSFGKPVTTRVGDADRVVILIGEGYATLASAHAATGHACIVAFDAGNLPKVAKALRERFPDAVLLALADNDQWTKGNPGVKKAQQAADESGCLVAIPPFDHSEGKPDGEGGLKGPSDFNDLHELRGLDAVRQVIEAALNPPAAEPEPLESSGEVPPWGDEPEQAEKAAPASKPAPDDDEDDVIPEKNGYFTILGYNRDVYYLFQHGKRQITEIKKGDMGTVGLIALAPLNWWEMNFPGSSQKAAIDTNAAAEFIIRTAERRGIFDTEKIRGRGAWIDEGRVVYHHGSHLTVAGDPVDVTKIDSRYVYELDKSMQMPADVMLSNADGKRLLDVMKMFRWSVDGSALLFAGWVALAPVCGAIPWRPHIWMTGGAGSGKSSLAKFGHALLKGTDVFAQGNSSEAGIRQRLRADARPVIMDESESNEEGDARRVQSILGLIRQASTESDAETLKGTTDGGGMTYHIRSMFCLASIQVALKHKADIDRLTVLTLKSGDPRDPEPEDQWPKMKEAIYQMTERDQDFRARLLRRCIDLLPVTLRNIEVFSRVGAEHFGSQRDGDQYGALLAGSWSLVSTGVATPDQARAMFRSHDWRDLRDNADIDESQRALSSLMGAKIRVKGGVEVTVYELVKSASGFDTGIVEISDVTADAILQRHGMRVIGGMLVMSNTSNEIKKLMQGTTFEADWRGMLLRVDGADKNGNEAIRFSGVQTKCIRVPLAPIVGDKPKEPAF
jgi:putative DNA primase/helicase